MGGFGQDMFGSGWDEYRDSVEFRCNKMRDNY